jgi:hypothetical protein
MEFRLLLRFWMRQFGWWFFAYLLAYGAAMWALASQPPGSVRTLLVLAPIVPGLAMIFATLVAYQRGDEFVQREILIATGIAALFTAAWTLVYAYLEPLGFPHLNVGFVHTFGWPIFLWRMVRLVRMRA